MPSCPPTMGLPSIVGASGNCPCPTSPGLRKDRGMEVGGRGYSVGLDPWGTSPRERGQANFPQLCSPAGSGQSLLFPRQQAAHLLKGLRDASVCPEDH